MMPKALRHAGQGRNRSFPTLKLPFWDTDFKVFIKKQYSEGTFDPHPFPAQEIQTEKPASLRKS